MKLVADSSGLVSIASTEDARERALKLLLSGYEVAVPTQGIEELSEIAQCDDAHGVAAQAVLDRKSDLRVESVDLEPSFPLDDGENAAVQLANRLGADFLYCDEYTQLALIHASLSKTQLVTTPRLLKAFVTAGECSQSEAKRLLAAIAAVRSWETNAYVQQATGLFEGST